ncbi:hypothetical protein EYZ11_013172 [Aspergillus tanneri]|uniref:Secreted protein n=1 Tax=Aspergillus tanneri TaxID=1220188 RepID=A0A4S3J3S3_9EURO|nr:hypothetical protein EYZ11_013172 [Aspergillus tanneri]
MLDRLPTFALLLMLTVFVRQIPDHAMDGPLLVPTYSPFPSSAATRGNAVCHMRRTFYRFSS